MTFDLERAVKEGCRTRDGRPVRIICDDLRLADGDLEIVAAVSHRDGGGSFETVEHYNQFGRHCEQTTVDGCPIDLVNLPESHEVQIQVCRQIGSKLPWPYDARVWINGKLIANPQGHCLGDDIEWEEWGKPVTVRIEKED